MHKAAALLFTCAIACLSSGSSFAQALKPINIGILAANVVQGEQAPVYKAVEQFIYQKFVDQKRFNVIERARFNAVNAERAFQDFNDTKNKAKIKNTGADYVVFTDVTATDVRRVTEPAHYTKKGNLISEITYYDATISFGIRIIDVSTGEVAKAQTFSSGRGGILSSFGSILGGSNSTPAGAIDIALSQNNKALMQFISSSFPTVGYVMAIETKDKKGFPETVLVSIGSADGVTKSSKLQIYETQQLTAGGNTISRKKPVAILAFVRGEGDHITLGKVTNGADILLSVADANTLKVEIVQ